MKTTYNVAMDILTSDKLTTPEMRENAWKIVTQADGERSTTINTSIDWGIPKYFAGIRWIGWLYQK
jgi:hypothetical protein